MQKFNINLVKSFIKENKIIRSFFVEKKNQKTTTFFVKKVDKKTTPFRIRNSLVKTFLQYSESPSLRGFAEAIYINWIASLISFVRNDNLKICNDDKNNFANLNLVKHFSASITFDSLSRKIKIPCLVINKISFFKEDIHMSNIKKIFTYMVVGALVMALSISCKSNEDPGSGGGVDLGSIPTASGTAATASELSTYNGKTYTGTIGSGVTRKSYNSNPQEFGDNFSLEETGNTDVQVVITDNKIYYTGMGSTESKVQIYKSADGNSYIASEETSIEGTEVTYKSYIQITFNSATEISIYLHMGAGGNGGYYTVEYEGTLTEQTK
ncbi:hypothetical protein [Brachyspira sp.]|uniref:hypothetical protein n=1 Tax=Brachyspira sp. TaxID=1977261 RepID=UPI003D7D3A02